MTLEHLEIGTVATDGTEYAIVSETEESECGKYYAWADLTDEQERQDEAVYVSDFDKEYC